MKTIKFLQESFEFLESKGMFVPYFFFDLF